MARALLLVLGVLLLTLGVHGISLQGRAEQEPAVAQEEAGAPASVAPPPAEGGLPAGPLTGVPAAVPGSIVPGLVIPGGPGTDSNEGNDSGEDGANGEGGEGGEGGEAGDDDDTDSDDDGEEDEPIRKYEQLSLDPNWSLDMKVLKGAAEASIEATQKLKGVRKAMRKECRMPSCPLDAQERYLGPKDKDE